MYRKWYLASLLLGENGAWSRLGRVDMDTDEALQMFFDEEDAPTFLLRDFLTQICLRATMSSSPTTGPAILPPLTRKPPAQTRKISMARREWTTKRWRRKQFRVRESVNLNNITSPERVETWFFGFSDLSAFTIYGTSYLQKWMVVELFAHTLGVVKMALFTKL